MKHPACNSSTPPLFKIMTDLDKTFQPANELDRENLLLLGMQIEASGGRLDITPITGRPAGYVPGILEQVNLIFSNYDLDGPCKFGYGESGMIQTIPISAEHQEFIFKHDPKIMQEATHIREKVYTLLANEFGMQPDRDFITDPSRKYSTVIQPMHPVLSDWKKENKERLISLLLSDREIGGLVNCFRNDAEAVQIDHLHLDKSKTLAYEILRELQQHAKIHSLCFACDGDNDVAAASWMIQFSKGVARCRLNLKQGLHPSLALKPVIACFKGFEPLLTPEVTKDLLENIVHGFLNLHVFLPYQAHKELINLKEAHPDIVCHSDKNVLTGVLDCISQQWNFPLDLSYDSIVKDIGMTSSPMQRTQLRKELNQYRRQNLKDIEQYLDNKYPNTLDQNKEEKRSKKENLSLAI